MARSIRKDHEIFVIGDDGNRRSFFVDKGMAWILEEYGLISPEGREKTYITTPEVIELLQRSTFTTGNYLEAKSIDYGLMALAFIQGVAWANNH